MYNVKNFSNKRGDELQHDIKKWVEGMSSIDIDAMSIWYDSKNHIHLATIVYTSYIHQ